ncbi:MAG: mandelate racemase/muconate lactonizing enzyme family protein [Halobacteriaceae archaeon]
MQVTDVEAIPLVHELPEGRTLGSSRGQTGERFTTLVRLETDDGTVGWGEAFAPARTVATLVEEVFADRVLGLDPHDAASFVEESYTTGYHFGRASFVRCAVSGIDVALHDILGKATGQPIHKLLGGGAVDSLTPYASTGYVSSWDWSVAEQVGTAAEEGFTAAKIKIGTGIEEDVQRVRDAREALGEDATLMVDYNGNYRPKQALQSVEAIEPYDVAWIEEPVPAENLSGYRELSQQVDVPLAAGEAHFSRFEFRDLVEDRTVDVVQPNLGRCGGFTEAKLIGQMATTENVAVRPHVWNSGVGVAAAVQFAATVPDYPHNTNVVDPLLFEFDRSENPLRHEILDDPFDPTGGDLPVPDDPGLGIEIDEEAVERYRVDT